MRGIVVDLFDENFKKINFISDVFYLDITINETELPQQDNMRDVQQQ